MFELKLFACVAHFYYNLQNVSKAKVAYLGMEDVVVFTLMTVRNFASDCNWGQTIKIADGHGTAWSGTSSTGSARLKHVAVFDLVVETDQACW